MDWTEVLGYQHEVMHTGVLAHLLRGDRACNVAASILQPDDVADVEDVRRERRLNRGRPVDLAACIVKQDGSRSRIAVEIKVDSAWTPRQLRESVPADCDVILLAVGYTALAVTNRDLDALSPESARWRLVGPREWGTLVGDHAGDDRELECYARRVLDEAADQDAALEGVAAGRPTTEGRGRDPETLGHWAYFHEVIHEREDVAEWERKTLRSGPLLTRWVALHDGGNGGDYLEFMGEGPRRSLCVKTFAAAGTGALAESRDRLRALLADDHKTPEPKRPGAKDKTCTAARWWLDDVSPQEASKRADDLQVRLEGQAGSGGATR